MTHTSHQQPVQIGKLALIATATAVVTLVSAATAHACGCGGSVDPAYITHTFWSPSGNIACEYQVGFDSDPNKGFVDCEVSDHTWVAPRDPSCAGRHVDGDELSMIGEASQPLDAGPDDPVYRGFRLGLPTWGCYSGSGPLGGPHESTLEYGQTLSVGPITCDSEPSGVTCTGSSTGHFFRVSRESYQLG